MSRVLTMHCPHCRARTRVRTSKEVSLTMREITFTCTNHICGHVWVSTLEAARTLSPSSVPNLLVRIPLSAHINKSDLMKQLTDPQNDLFALPDTG